MRFIALLAVLGILYVILTRHSPADSAKKAVAEAEAVAPAPVARPAPTAPSAAPAPTTGLRRPIARTREVLGEVKARNGAGQF